MDSVYGTTIRAISGFRKLLWRKASAIKVNSRIGPGCRPSKCPKFCTTLISSEKSVNFVKTEITTKSCNFQVIHHLKNIIIYICKYHVNTPLKLKNNFFLSFSWNVTQKKRPKLIKFFFSQKNTLWWEQQIYTSQENLTQLLVSVVETFRRSAWLVYKWNI